MDAKQTKILLLTLSEYGQANTILALASELCSRENTLVHVGSFPVIQKRVEDIKARIPDGVRGRTSVEFHALPGKPFMQQVKDLGMDMKLARHVPLKDSLKGLELLEFIAAPYVGPEYSALVDAVKQIIVGVDADMIVVDTLFSAAIDACRSLQRRYIVNSPIQTVDLVGRIQPRMASIWKYPAMGSGISYPLPWIQIPNNIWITVNMIYAFITNPRLKTYQQDRLDQGLKGPAPPMDTYRKELDYITPSIREVDYPFSYLPENVGMFGPIVLDSPPVEESDPELARWLSKPGTRTVLICLGSHIQYNEKLIGGVISGLINGVPNDVQILWKLDKNPSTISLARDLVEKQDHSTQKTSRWRIVGWLEADPIAILQHENVACFVHHGGANSYFECCLSGTPQIILPQWYDLYLNADRAEYNGLGIYGSKTSAPDVDKVEFGAALARVLGDSKEAGVFRAKAKEVASLCGEAGGRKAAADYILTVVKRGKMMQALC